MLAGKAREKSQIDPILPMYNVHVSHSVVLARSRQDVRWDVLPIFHQQSKLDAKIYVSLLLVQAMGCNNFVNSLCLAPPPQKRPLHEGKGFVLAAICVSFSSQFSKTWIG